MRVPDYLVISSHEEHPGKPGHIAVTITGHRVRKVFTTTAGELRGIADVYDPPK